MSRGYLLLLGTLLPLIYASLNLGSSGGIPPFGMVLQYVYPVAALFLLFGFSRLAFSGAGLRFAGWIRLALGMGIVGFLFNFAGQWLGRFVDSWGGGKGDPLEFVATTAVEVVGRIHHSASSADNFLVTLLAFSATASLLVEFCKAIPAAGRSESGSSWDLRWQAVAAVGFACGVGFGVGQATYLELFYAGGQGSIWHVLVRFVALAALQGVWTACAALLLRKADLDSLLSRLLALAPSILLHGLYRALFFHGYIIGGLAVSLLSLGLLIGLIETSRRREQALAPGEDDQFGEDATRVPHPSIPVPSNQKQRYLWALAMIFGPLIVGALVGIWIRGGDNAIEGVWMTSAAIAATGLISFCWEPVNRLAEWLGGPRSMLAPLVALAGFLVIYLAGFATAVLWGMTTFLYLPDSPFPQLIIQHALSLVSMIAIALWMRGQSAEKGPFAPRYKSRSELEMESVAN